MSGFLKGFVSGFKRGQKKFGDSIAAIVNTVLLTVVYVIGVGFTTLFAKIARKEFLEMKTSESTKSYWTELNLGTRKKEDYYRQF